MSRFPTRETFAAALQSFINHELPLLHSRLKAPPNVAADTPLFAQGLIDSLAILHLIAWVEGAIGRRVSNDEVVMSHFQSVDAIAATFWQPETDARLRACS